jgi:hypothetical protein
MRRPNRRVALPRARPSRIMRRVDHRQAIEPEVRHRLCWYSRRTPDFSADLVFYTIEDSQLLYCAHPMLFPVVGYQFDVRNCDGCEYFRASRHPLKPGA